VSVLVKRVVLIGIPAAFILSACDSSECNLAKQREVAARLASEEAKMKLEGTAIRRELIIEANREKESNGLGDLKQEVPPPVRSYPGQEEFEDRLLRESVFANSEERQAKKLRARVCR